MSSINKQQIKRIVESYVVDFDMHNLFPSNTLTEEWEEAGSGIWDAPERTLREKHYGPQPLMLRPDYSGDFLEKLKQQKQAASSENLLDFSMPSEMLKHQEEPYPRDMADDFYETNRPGEGAGMDILRDYYDRSWDTFDAPEMSEDKIDRMQFPYKVLIPETGKSPFRSSKRVIRAWLQDVCDPDDLSPSRVVASYLMQEYPEELILDDNMRVAMTLDDLNKAKIYSKEKGYQNYKKGVMVVPGRGSNPSIGKWVFRTTSGGPAYTTIFQFIPEGSVRDAGRLHVRVSCSCPSWLFWGPQYNAVMKSYVYGPIQPKFAPPKVRDPAGRCLVCKHVMACIPIVKGYKLPTIPREIRDKIIKTPKIRVKKEIPEEKVKIPPELKGIARRPNIKEIESEWDTTSDRLRKSLIQKLKDPSEVSYFGHRFPATATGYVAEKLVEMSKNKALSPSIRKKAQELIADLPEAPKEDIPKEVVIPAELKKWDRSLVATGLAKTLPGMADIEKRKALMSKNDPDLLAYLAHKLHDNPVVVETIIERLKDLSKIKKYQGKPEERLKDIGPKTAAEEDMPDNVAERAEYWLRRII
jgi:hypothetical protein